MTEGHNGKQQCKYSVPESDQGFIEEYSPFIKNIIFRFDWGGVRHVAIAQTDDLYQELMLSWVQRGYLSIYDANSQHVNPRTGNPVRCTFKNFVYQFVIRRLFNWRDQFNRQVYRIKTECVEAGPDDTTCDMEIDGIRYIYRKRFIRNIAMQELVTDEEKEIIFEDDSEDPAQFVVDSDSLKVRCEFIYGQLRQMRVVSKRDYAKLFLYIVRMSFEQGGVVLQADLADKFGVSASTISLMIKQMRSIPVIREFRSTIEHDLICK